MSETLQTLYSREALQVDPIFSQYLQAPDDDASFGSNLNSKRVAGRAYQMAAQSWLADASTALQAAPSGDVWAPRVATRFDVVVKHIQAIDAAGYGTGVTGWERFTGFVSDTGKGVAANAAKLGGAATDWGKILLALAAIWGAVKLFGGRS